MIREISGHELDEMVEQGAVVVCDFFATWCMPCRMLGQTLEALEKEYEGRATFVKVNVDENGDLAASLGIFSIPDLYVFAEGKPKAHNLGYLPEEELRAFLNANI